MIALLCICVYMFLTTVAVGLLVVKLFNRFIFTGPARPSPSADILSIIGLAVLGTLLSYYSLLFKLGGVYPHFFVMSLVILSFASCFDEWRGLFLPSEGLALNGWFVALVLLFVLGILHYSVQAPKHYDTSLYHAQAIQWIEQYAAVPGLGNLHGRLAFNSSVHVLSAFYGFSFLGGQTFFAVNPYGVMLVTISMLVNIRKDILYRGDYQRACILILVFLFFYFLLSGEDFSPSSPSTDIMPVVLLTYLFLVVSRSEDLVDENVRLILLTLLPAFLITVKLSQLPLMIFTAGLLFNRTLKYSQRFVLAAVPTALTVLPWVLRNIVQSGYLVYPLPQIDLLSVDWKVPYETAMSDNRWIRSWAIMQFRHHDEVLSLPVKSWLVPWFGVLLKRYKVLLLVAALSPLVIGAAFAMGKIRKQLVFFWCVCFLGCLFWFANAPDVRFALGLILYCAAIPLSVFSDVLKKARPNVVYGVLVVLLVISVMRDVVLPAKRAYQRMGRSQAAELYGRPEILKEVPLTYARARNITVSRPVTGDQCSIAPIPCTPYFNPNFEMRGDGLQSGFRIARP